MNDTGTVLLELIGEDRQGNYITMLDDLFRFLAVFCVIERAVSIHAVRAVLQHSMAENVIGTIVLMIPDQRPGQSIAIFECVSHNGPTIGAAQIVSGGPASKVILLWLHFDFPPSRNLMGIPHLERLDLSSSIRRLSDRWTASYQQSAGSRWTS